MAYKPYKLLNRSELLFIEGAIRKSFHRWLETWHGKTEECTIVCQPADALAGQLLLGEPFWLNAQADNQNWIAVTSPTKSLGEFAADFFPAREHHVKPADVKQSVFIGELAISALNDLLKHLFAQEKSTEQNKRLMQLPDTACAQKGSGAVAAELNSAAGQFILVLSAGQVNSMLAGMPRPQHKKLQSLEKFDDSFNKERLSLKVKVGEVQLELGLLQTIMIGDVIKLETPISQPLEVVNAEGVRLCGAYLGTCNGKKSIQLTK